MSERTEETTTSRGTGTPQQAGHMPTPPPGGGRAVQSAHDVARQVRGNTSAKGAAAAAIRTIGQTLVNLADLESCKQFGQNILNGAETIAEAVLQNTERADEHGKVIGAPDNPATPSPIPNTQLGAEHATATAAKQS